MTNVVGTVTAGNTKVRSYMFTFFDDDEVKEFLNLESKYLLLGWEICPKTGKKHAHGCVYFSNARSFNNMKSLFPTTHIERLKDWSTAIPYCKKDGAWEEYGECPKSHRFLGDELKNMTDGEIAMRYPMNARSLICSKNTILAEEKLNAFLQDVKERKDVKPEVVFIQGGSGSGKTRMAWEMATDEYPSSMIGFLNFSNGFAHGARLDAPCIIMDEFRPSELHAAEFLKLIDRYVYSENIKQSSIVIRPKKIIITSILPITEIYKEELNGQFRRRVTKFIDLGYPPEVVRIRQEDDGIHRILRL